MEPHDAFHQIYYVYILTAQRLCGCELVLPNYRPHRVTYVAVLCFCSYIVASVYTVAVYDVDAKWKCLCCLPIALQSLVKFVVLIRFYQPLADKIALIQHIYRVNGRPGAANYATLVEWSRLGVTLCRLGMASIVATGVAYLAVIMGHNVLTGRLDPLMPVYLWGVDERSLAGYALLSAYHLVLTGFGCIGIACSDMLMTMFVVHMMPMARILDGMFAQMNGRLRAGVRMEDSREFDGFFRNTIRVHKEICEYISGIAEYYYFYLMFEVYTDALIMCLGIYCILEIHAYQLYAVMCLTFFKLLLFCILGTVVESTTTDIYSTIIRSEWNAMPVRTQRMMRLMIARAQTPAILMAGTIALNLDTFVAVMRKVYTVGMILIESTNA